MSYDQPGGYDKPKSGNEKDIGGQGVVKIDVLKLGIQIYAAL
jgi:hypothetical protein